MSEPKTLGDALPDEIARVTEILGLYQEIGPASMQALGERTWMKMAIPKNLN